MIRDTPAAIAMALMIAVACALLVRPVLRRLPEPADAGGKPPYRDLASIRFLLSCGVLAGVASRGLRGVNRAEPHSLREHRRSGVTNE